MCTTQGIKLQVILIYFVLREMTAGGKMAMRIGKLIMLAFDRDKLVIKKFGIISRLAAIDIHLDLILLLFFCNALMWNPIHCTGSSILLTWKWDVFGSVVGSVWVLELYRGFLNLDGPRA